MPPSLGLYDDVPGGAGHVRSILAAWEEALRVAHACVRAYECRPETSWHRCLRGYRNQYYQDELECGVAEDALRRLLGRQGRLITMRKEARLVVTNRASLRLAEGQGFEPRSAVPETAVLPLDDPSATQIFYINLCLAANPASLVSSPL